MSSHQTIEDGTASAATALLVPSDPAAPPPREVDRRAWPRPATVFVVPAFDEEANLPRLLADLESRPRLFPPGSTLLVVDDGSSDGTLALLDAYDGPLPLEVLPLGVNQGPGAAFRAGFREAITRLPEDGLVVTLEADNTSDLGALPLMLARASRGADLVLASVHGGGHMVNVNLLRRALSHAAGMVVRSGLRLDARTVSSFFRVYRASALRAAFDRYGDDLIRERGFACKAELLAKLSSTGATVEEVPVDLDGSQRIGESKMRILPTLAGYGRLMLRAQILRETGTR